MAVAELNAEQLLTSKPENQVLVVWRRFRCHRLAVVGAWVSFCSSSSLRLQRRPLLHTHGTK